MYTPVNPSFTIQKWGLRGSKLYRDVFVMLRKYQSLLSAKNKKNISVSSAEFLPSILCVRTMLNWFFKTLLVVIV